MVDPEPRQDLRELSDERLMQRYVDGDTSAFDELFRRYERRAFAYFLRRSHSPDRAQDLYQDLFLRVHRAREDFDPQRRFAPWFFQIAHRLLIDDERRVRRAREFPIDGAELAVVDASHADSLAEREQLAHLLQDLSDDEIYILVSAKGEGVGYLELAGQVGRSADAVRKSASRAMRRLRAAIGVRASAIAPARRRTTPGHSE